MDYDSCFYEADKDLKLPFQPRKDKLVYIKNKYATNIRQVKEDVHSELHAREARPVYQLRMSREQAIQDRVDRWHEVQRAQEAVKARKQEMEGQRRRARVLANLNVSIRGQDSLRVKKSGRLTGVASSDDIPEALMKRYIDEGLIKVASEPNSTPLTSQPTNDSVKKPKRDASPPRTVLKTDARGNVIVIHVIGEDSEKSTFDGNSNSLSCDPPMPPVEKRRRMHDYWDKTVKAGHAPAKSATQEIEIGLRQQSLVTKRLHQFTRIPIEKLVEMAERSGRVS